MKKVISLFAILFCATLVNAQVNKGQFLLGGAAGFSSQNTGGGGGTVTEVKLYPSFGYFFADKLAAGATVEYQSQTAGGSTSSAFGFGPFVRYYFLDADAKTNVFAQAQFITASVSSGGVSQSATGFGIAAGPAFFLTPNVALELGAVYTTSSSGGVSTNSFGIQAGFQIHIGK